MKKYNNQEGFTLIEAFVAFTLISIIMTAFISYFLFCVKSCSRQIEILNTKENIRCALTYIERSIKICNQQKISYHDALKRFEGENQKGHKIYIDLSGKKQYKNHTLIYFYRNKGQLRTNKNGEHNILLDGIKDIIVTEIIKNKLIEIEVLGNYNKSVKARLKINN
ncbi:PilW family protein [Crassaminicella indica]|uniref:Prepilin-type N-terminal cleavage/methylation domain-containing protein n=1 Tax=Crassaminicella indica TaxID=2855394 RepID=A0ABX8RC29_9CLOT|nr:prepilin-type N-terminal cleavage/methylation domain-containing protein [Crassaminicella indica]QXM06009.1 prepilin-type N-terminal cleavage/methylation domain-containing protein [Crassaminicella indica]